ncbi:hypothetical protein LOTGIDRAFT_168869 [Lottia gigantea]|uniref:Uncharacterized protein n=1 Tax=Lottia gigantea TaxID=225164 RepID=V4B781_LOTGI|nr:hypothetical protein LOTGIDRAFT_168869 [Lottia gigantea]ESO84414.1 hypothetical protein LOTGIDRAFT_168869 [Lottia gigantea]
METNKVNTATKRVSLSEGTFRIFAKSVRDVTSNKLKKDRSGSTSTTSSSNESSPNKDSPFLEGKKSSGTKMSDESVIETPEKRKTPESLSPTKSHSPAKINRIDSQQKTLKSKRSIGIELENLKENCPANDLSLEDHESLLVPKNGGKDKNSRVDELATKNNVDTPETTKDVKTDEPKTTNVMMKNQHQHYKPNRHKNPDHLQPCRINRNQYPDHHQPRRHDSHYSMDQRTHGRLNQCFDNERRHSHPDRNQPPRFRAERFSRPRETKKENKSKNEEDWNEDLLDVEEKLDDPKSAKVFSTSLPNENTWEASSAALNSSCPELDQDTKVPISLSDIDKTKEIVSVYLQGNKNCDSSNIHSKHPEQPGFESSKGEVEDNLDHGHDLAAPEAKNKTNELSDLTDKIALDLKEIARNLVQNNKDSNEDSQVVTESPELNEHSGSIPEDYNAYPSDAVSSNIAQAPPGKETFKDGLIVKVPQMTERFDAVDNTEDWSDELTEVPTPGKVVQEVHDEMTDIHKPQPSNQHNGSAKCSDTVNDFVDCMSDLQGSSKSKLESELNWAEGWTGSNLDTSSADAKGISIEGATQEISNSPDAGEKAALLPQSCLKFAENLEKSVPRADNNQAEGLRNFESKDLIANTEDVLPETNSNQPIISLQDGIPRMKAIFARGGIRPSHSSRGAHSYNYTERGSTALNKDIIKPHPLMSFELEGSWEKVLENNTVELDEEEVFDSEINTPQNVEQPSPVTDTSKDPNNNLKGTSDIVPGNVAPQFSQDIRRKSSIKEDQKQIGLNQNQNDSPPIVNRRSTCDSRSENSDSVKHLRPPRKNTQTPPLRPRNDDLLDAELKKIDVYLGITKQPKKSEHHASSHKKHIRPRTHSERFEKSERKGFKNVKPYKNDKSNKSEDWSSDLLDVQSAPVEPHHFTEKLQDGSCNSFQNISNYSNKSDSIPIPDNSLLDIYANYSPYCNVNNQSKQNSPQRSHIKEKTPSPQISHPTEIKGKSRERDPGQNQIEISRCKNDSKNFKLPNIQNESVQSLKEFSMDRDFSGDKHGFLTSSKMSISNNAVPISDAFSDFSSVGSDDDILRQTDSKTDPKKPARSESSISLKSKRHYRYSSQDMSISETISSMSTDPRYQKSQKTEINDMDYRHKPPMPPNPLEYPYYHPGKSAPGPPFDPRLFNPYIPFYPPYMYPAYYPGYDTTLMEQHQKIEEERCHVKQERKEAKKDPDSNKKSVQKESKDTDQHGHIPNLSHLITVPLNKITDLQQAQLLLQFVDQLVRKVPNASGAYYRAVSNQGEPSLEVGATTEPTLQNKNKTKSPVKYRPSSLHLHERRPSAPNDGSSMKPHYQYQPRYPTPQYNPMEGPQYPHQDLPSQILQYPDAALKTVEDNRYHDYRNYCKFFGIKLLLNHLLFLFCAPFLFC